MDRHIPLFKVFMNENVMQPLEQVLMSGYIGQGDKVEEFEKKLSEYIGSHYVNTVNTGTSGLHLALHMIKQGTDKTKILTTSSTCTATNWPILANGFDLEWVDIDESTGNLCLEDLRRRMSPDVAGIMVVHWGGNPVDLDELASIQDEAEDLYGYRPPVVEDCAHAFGSKYKGKRIGAHGNYCMFSFQAIKHLTCGDGGLLVCPDDHTYKLAKLVRWYGLDRTGSADFRCEQNVENWGFKFHMNDISATIGLANMEHIDDIVERHLDNGNYYNNALANADGVELITITPGAEPSYWIYTLKVDRRYDFIRMMKSKGIGVSQVHDRNDKHLCVQDYKRPLPSLSRFVKKMICIPCGWWVSDEDREYIVDCIRGGW